MACDENIKVRTITFIFLFICPGYGKYCSYLYGRTYLNRGSCTKLEHCVSSFNTQTGDCPGPGNQCEPGWMGPGCQYVNLALNPLNRDIVFDGNITSHRTLLSATVHLNGKFIVNAFIIHTNSQLGLLTVTGKNKTVLLQDNVQVVSPTIVLPHPVMTDQLNMQFGRSIYISEIEVFGGKNVALWKSTNQSSTYISTEQRVYFTSDKAVDGSGDGNFNVGLTCTHTAVNQTHSRKWHVNLGKAYSIIAIKITNRIDNQQRINGFKLFGKGENGTKLLIYSDPSPYQTRNEIVLDSTHMPDVPVSVITIEGPNTGERILTLCEVYVYACIPTSEGTDQCRSFCSENCRSEYSCKNGCHVCQDGWIGPYCKNPIICHPPVPRDTTHLSTNKQTYRYNETIRFGCSEGYVLQGAQEKQCTKNGPLEPPFPICAAITCQSPDFPNDLHIITDKETYNYNETIKFSCSEGFYLQATQGRRCTRNGTFQPPYPICKAITCQSPDFPNDLHIITDKETYNYNETIKFSCSEGFYLQATQGRRCTRNGTLQPPYPICKVITCQRPILTSELHLSSNPFKQTFYFNESVSFFCSVGFHLQGSSIKYCTKTDDFRYDLPTCSNITCQRPNLKTTSALQLNTNTLQQTFSYNDSISFTCSLGYILQGPTKKYCQQIGDFEHNLPTCAEIQSTQISLTVAFLSGGAIGIVLISSVMIVIIIIRRRRNLPKKKKNTNYEERIHQSDLNDHEYAGIERIPNFSEGDFTKVSSDSEIIDPYHTVRGENYEETSTSQDEKDHEYTELKMVQISLPRKTTDKRPSDS